MQQIIKFLTQETPFQYFLFQQQNTDSSYYKAWK